ncbi:MAG: SPOR domain-containing protein [Sutterellaceae bacterium]|nr:SPOR domain-containing protein [Sutterellaceae bacterium]
MSSGVQALSENKKSATPTSSDFIAASVPVATQVLVNTVRETKTDVVPNQSQPVIQTKNVSRETVTVSEPETQTATTTSEVIAIDTVSDLIDETVDRGEPSVSLSFSIEETSTPEAGQAIAAGTSGDKISAQDAIGAILAEEQQLASEPKHVPPTKQSVKSVEIAPWSVQLGAYSVEDNAKAWAGHAENLLEQDNLGPVEIVQTGSMYKIYAGHSATQNEAKDLAQRISEKLGIKAIAVKRD